MSTFETSAVVDAHGQLIVAGVPFAPGTEVRLSISASHPRGVGDAVDETSTPRLAQINELFAALDKGRNLESVSTFQREEVYDRNALH